MAEQLKQWRCPHCQVAGALIRHGALRAKDPTTRCWTIRTRRIFCSNRSRRPGCGRTFSVHCADNIHRLSVGADVLWQFLQLAVACSVVAAFAAVHALGCGLSQRTWQRLWQRFKRGQTLIRTALGPRCPPPDVLPRPPSHPNRLPEAQTLAHLQSAFPDVVCPIAAFQHALNAFFL